MFVFNNRPWKCTWNTGKASELHSYIGPRILRNVEGSLISVLAHTFLCVFLSLDLNVLEELRFSPASAPPDIAPLCSFSCIKQHSILFPSPSILLPYVVHLPCLTAPTCPSSLILIPGSFLPLSAFSCARALSNTIPVPTEGPAPWAGLH